MTFSGNGCQCVRSHDPDLAVVVANGGGSRRNQRGLEPAPVKQTPVTPTFPIVLEQGAVISLPSSSCELGNSGRSFCNNVIGGGLEGGEYLVEFAAGGFPTAVPTVASRLLFPGAAGRTREGGGGEDRQDSNDHDANRSDHHHMDDGSGVDSAQFRVLYAVLASPAEAEVVAKEALVGEDVVSPGFRDRGGDRHGRGRREGAGLPEEILGGVAEQVSQVLVSSFFRRSFLYYLGPI